MSDNQLQMIDDPVKEANVQQCLASNPNVSVFVSASAGSGKTKLLVDRLLRLMLPRYDQDNKLCLGTHPRKIQCLTYSKAAAAEMAIRLQHKLSDWVGLSDQALQQELYQLELPASPEMLKAARALFAEVLDLPGGMRIETNHAFCQSILQRFPLEASIIPQFKIIEQGDNILAFKRAFDEKIGDVSDEDIALLSPVVNVANFLEILQELQQHQRFLPEIIRLIENNQFSQYLLTILELPNQNKKQYFESVCHHWPEEDRLKSKMQFALQAKSKSLIKIADNILYWLSAPITQRIKEWESWKKIFLTTEGDVRKFKGTKDDDPTISECLCIHAEFLQEIIENLNRYEVYEYTLSLMRVFLPIWQRYQEIKRTQGSLYYNDLIDYTLGLLDDPGSAWVLYKLDGGLDHILLDEVQDNSAEQWKIAANLSTEFFSGLGSQEDRDVPRTVFAVGDYKQSIYSFQGAKPEEFSYWNQEFRKQVQNAQLEWKEPELRVSFRSSQIILDFVDQVFHPSQQLQGLAGQKDIMNKHIIHHRSARSEAPGRVDIWPIVTEAMDQNEDDSDIWHILQSNQNYSSPERMLAEELASWIGQQIGQVPPYGGKPIQAGDILILIRKRTQFSKLLIRSLKSHNIPLANLIQTQLLDQLAVQDLLALCEILLLPEDDLTLACVLKSPLGGLSEDSLMELAATRPGGQTLWGCLFLRHKEREDWRLAWKMLSNLFLRIDYITPYALLVEVLGEYHGRSKLLARLGTEAIEGIDELLSQALLYEESHTPSLQGFLHWLKQSERTIKNEAESNLNMVRIMTVHGAKGLQGRLVIVPDKIASRSTLSGFRSDMAVVWKQDHRDGMMIPLYIPRRDFSIQERESYKETKKQIDHEEGNRLLYVALTRASEWLLICGWGSKGKAKDHQELIDNLPVGNWYKHSITAIEQLGPHLIPFNGNWEGYQVYIQHCLPDDKVMPNPVVIHEANITQTKLPSWMGKEQGWKASPLPSDDYIPAVQLTPSRPDGVDMGEVPSVISPLQTIAKKDPFYRGRLVHQLLQYLPDCPKEERYQVGLRWLKKLHTQFTDYDLEKLIHNIVQTMEHPDLAPLFDSEAFVEQPLIGTVNGIVITGQIDRMRILSDQILLCDFKSGYQIPKNPENVPVIYLKQMAAYLFLLKDLYPTHQIKPFIVWTDATKIMLLPEQLLEGYQPGNQNKVS